MNKLIDYKRTYKGNDGEDYLFLGLPSYDISKLNVISMLNINKNFNGRIDKFTKYNVGEFDDIDLVMYANHIFNPFSIKEGDILYTPTSDDFYYESEEPKLIDGTTHSETLNNEKPMSYAETVELMAKLGLGI